MSIVPSPTAFSEFGSSLDSFSPSIDPGLIALFGQFPALTTPPSPTLSKEYVHTLTNLNVDLLGLFAELPSLATSLQIHAMLPRIIQRHGSHEMQIVSEKATLLANLFARSSSLLLAKVNAANSTYYNLPDDVHLHILSFVFEAFLPCVSRWNVTNQGWIPSTQVCAKIRAISLKNPQLWAGAVSHLPYAATIINARAGSLGAVIRLNNFVPRIPETQNPGTHKDNLRISALLRNVSAFETATIDLTEDRVSIPQALVWINQGAGWRNVLPKLATFIMHAPARFREDETELTEMSVMSNPAAVSMIETPALRTYEVSNCCRTFISPRLVKFSSVYETVPAPYAGKPSLVNVLSMLELSYATLEDIVLRNSLHSTSRPADRGLDTFHPRDFTRLRYLEISATADLILSALSKIRWTARAEVSLTVTLHLDPTQARDELRRVFQYLIASTGVQDNRAMYIRRDQPQIGSAMTHVFWTFDPVPLPATYNDYTGPCRRPNTASIAFQSQALFPWTEILTAFGDILNNLNYPRLRVLAMLVADVEWALSANYYYRALRGFRIPVSLYPKDRLLVALGQVTELSPPDFATFLASWRTPEALQPPVIAAPATADPGDDD